jgi:GNAT superfamily N-acetyltransferase
MAAKCSIDEVYMGVRNRFRFEANCDGQSVGRIEVHKTKVAGKTRWTVTEVRVRKQYRRRGIGTKLYEVAAAEACRRRAPLASTDRVGDVSRHFWAKQIAKGRANILSSRGGREAGEAAPVYQLTCPPPASLRGRRTRRRR